MKFNRRIVIISGLSGSGKSTVARTLEDEGYYVVDNLPLPLLGELINLINMELPNDVNVAVVIDVRNGLFLNEFTTQITKLENIGYQIDIVFLRANTETLLRRYSETRRKHPLSLDTLTAKEIAKEVALLQTPTAMASLTIDTTQHSPHSLRQFILEQFVEKEERKSMSLNIISFGYKYGTPSQADIVLDVRFLNNPYFEQELRSLSGKDSPVAEFVLSQKPAQTFISQTKKMCSFLLPEFINEGKRHLTLAIGCTGGRHRSVAVVEKLTNELSDILANIHSYHRDIQK